MFIICAHNFPIVFFYHFNGKKIIFVNHIATKPMFATLHSVNALEHNRNLDSFAVSLINQDDFRKIHYTTSNRNVEKKKIIIKKKNIHNKKNILKKILHTLYEKRIYKNHLINDNAKISQKGFFLKNALHNTILKNLKEKIVRCWHVPPDALLFSHSQITINLTLSPKGQVTHIDIISIAGSPMFQESLKRSVLDIFKQKSCQIFQLPINQYRLWNHIEITFSPNDLK